MKKSFAWIALLLIVTLMLALVSCTDPDKKNPDNGETTPVVETTPAPSNGDGGNNETNNGGSSVNDPYAEQGWGSPFPY